MKHTTKRLLSWALALCMLAGFQPTAHAAGVHWEKTDKTITAEVSDRPLREEQTEKRNPAEMVRVSL